MKKLFIAMALLGTLALAACGSSNSAVQKMDPTAFADAASQPGVVILDVRSPDEFASGHLTGATNINVEDPGFADAISGLDKNVTYAIYCQSGRRSGIATSQMTDAGFTKIVELEGGLQAWQQVGGQLATT